MHYTEYALLIISLKCLGKSLCIVIHELRKSVIAKLTKFNYSEMSIKDFENVSLITHTKPLFKLFMHPAVRHCPLL